MVDQRKALDNYRLFVRTLYTRLVKLNKQHLLSDYRLPTTEDEIINLERIEPKQYYIHTEIDSKPYHPKLVIEYNWRVASRGNTRIYILYSIKRFSKKFNLLNDVDNFDEIITKCLDALDSQWAIYQKTESVIRDMFVSLPIHEIVYLKHNVWKIHFNNNNNNKINGLAVWYYMKENKYTLQNSNITDVLFLNELLTNFR